MINIKEINISLFNVKQFIELNIICPNTEELNLYIYKEDPEINKYEINNIFSNIITLKLYIFKSFDWGLGIGDWGLGPIPIGF